MALEELPSRIQFQSISIRESKRESHNFAMFVMPRQDDSESRRAISNIVFRFRCFTDSSSELFRVAIRRVSAPTPHRTHSSFKYLCFDSVLLQAMQYHSLAVFQTFRLQLHDFPLFEHSTFARIQSFAHGHLYTVRKRDSPLVCERFSLHPRLNLSLHNPCHSFTLLCCRTSIGVRTLVTLIFNLGQPRT